MERSTRLRWRVGAAIVAAVLGCLCGAGIGACVAADTNWREMQEWAEASRREYDGRDFTRQVLHGEEQPGSAFECYERAMALAAVLRKDDGRLMRLLNKPGTLSAADAAALRAAWAPAVAAMREGAHRADARTQVRFESGFSVRMQSLGDCRRIVNSAVIQTREALAAGDGRSAVEILLDAATLGADLMRSPLLIDQMSGSALVAIVAMHGCTGDLLRALDRESLELLADGLRRLDELLPKALSYHGEVLLVAHAFLDCDRPLSAEKDWSWPVSWRHAFSRRWMVAEAFAEMRVFADELRAREQLPWSGRLAWMKQRTAELRSLPNPMLGMVVPHLVSAEGSLRRTLTEVRLVRLAVDHHRGVTPVDAADPLGDGPIAVRAGADAVCA